MRLGLRRKLHPYANLLELADAFDVTMPSLKRQLRELDSRGALSLEALAESFQVKASVAHEKDDLYLAFHRRNLCLVCGSPLERVKSRQAGWGEFSQCGFCQFSVHENADYQRLREVASAQIEELKETVGKAQRIFARRKQAGRALSARLGSARRASP